MRSSLIRDLEQVRNTRVVAYLTSDRQPFVAQIALDVLPLFYQTLQAIGKVEKLSLFLYSSGGNLDAPWPLLNLVREYCNYLEVLVPSKALSAATLLSLGANKIVMTPLSQLSPIDPEGTFVTEAQRQNYSVEDVMSFIEFAKEKVGIAESQPLSEVLAILTKEIKPQILGSLNRSHARVRRLARKMLQFTLNDPKYETQLTEIVTNLSQLLSSHNHLINRREARDIIGFKEIIEYADEPTEKAMSALFQSYTQDLELAKPFDPNELLKDKQPISITVSQAYIESLELSHCFESNILIQANPQTHEINLGQSGQQWRTRKVESEMTQ
ncbi:MAG: hypothetical protein HY741_08985 [Chloroflexi bacterium]|nr:hypothetical protein [Chloroflexota bacterium]